MPGAGLPPPDRASVARRGHTYESIRQDLDELSGRINGEFASVDWVPIRYVNQGYPREELAGFYRAAEIALVTPLRDGMNLVAKEYVAAQDPEDPGVLILSRFAGAAAQLKDALLINPYSKDEISDAIHQALKMPKEERVRRWQAMNESVRDEDVVAWRHAFVSALEGRAEVAATTRLRRPGKSPRIASHCRGGRGRLGGVSAGHRPPLRLPRQARLCSDLGADLPQWPCSAPLPALGPAVSVSSNVGQALPGG
jgi:hypothetical protein